MSRRKSAVVSPSPELTKSVLRRSARLTISQENLNGDEKPREEDLVSGSIPAPIPTEDKKPPRKSRRKLGKEVSKRLVNKLGVSIEDTKKSPGLNSSTLNGICSLKRSPRVSNWEYSDSKREKKSTPYSSKKPTFSSKSEIVSMESHGRNTPDDGSSCTPRRSPRFSSVGQTSSHGKKSGKSVVLGKCKSERGKGEKMVESSDRRKIRSIRVRSSKSKEILRACDEDEVSVCVSDRKKMRTYIDEELVECMDNKRSEIVLGLCASSSKPVLRANRGKRIGKGLLDESDRNCRRSRNHVHSKSKEILRACDEDSVCFNEKKKMRTLKPHGEVNETYNEEVECTNKKRPKLVSSTGIASSSEPVVKANKGKRRKNLLDERDEEEEEQSKTKHKLVEECKNMVESKGNCRKSKRSSVLPKSKKKLRACDEDEVSSCLKERKKMRISKPHAEVNGTCNEEKNSSSRVRLDSCIDKKKSKTVPGLGSTVTTKSSEPVLKADKEKRIKKEERLKTKKKPVEESKCENVKVWTKDQELALQRAYLTAKPSPNFWKKVSKMVHGKSAHECFDRMHKDLITPPQLQPRSRAKKATNLLSTTPQFSLSASKLSKPRQRGSRNNQSKKTIRQLLEKQKEQSPGFDLFSVLEPNNNVFLTPIEKTKKILEFPSSSSGSKLKPCSRFKPSTLISPPVLKQVKNKALHEKYIDQLHNREAKRRVADESSKVTGKEKVIRTIDPVKAAKDAIYFDVQDAIQKLKSIVSDENSSSSSEFCDEETEEED